MKAWLRRRRAEPEALDCRAVQRLMQSFLDGELDEAETGLVRAHLDRCEECGVEAETFAQVRAAIAALALPSDEAALARLRSTVEEITASDT